MKVVISGKNFNASDELKKTVEKKFGKLDKFFSDEIPANVKFKTEGGSKYKVEATINTKGTIFRAEDVTSEPYEGIDKVVDRLSTQMSKFRKKLER